MAERLECSGEEFVGGTGNDWKVLVCCRLPAAMETEAARRCKHDRKCMRDLSTRTDHTRYRLSPPTSFLFSLQTYANQNVSKVFRAHSPGKMRYFSKHATPYSFPTVLIYCCQNSLVQIRLSNEEICCLTLHFQNVFSRSVLTYAGRA